MLSEVNYDKVCDEVLKIDEKIRFTGVYVDMRLHSKMRNGMESLLNKSQTESSLNQALFRWKSDFKFAAQIGNPIFSTTSYEKVDRTTLPFGKEGVLCFSTEHGVDIFGIIKQVVDIIANNQPPES